MSKNKLLQATSQKLQTNEANPRRPDSSTERLAGSLWVVGSKSFDDDKKISLEELSTLKMRKAISKII